jgi:hypothetical protein
MIQSSPRRRKILQGDGRFPAAAEDYLSRFHFLQAAAKFSTATEDSPEKIHLLHDSSRFSMAASSSPGPLKIPRRRSVLGHLA